MEDGTELAEDKVKTALEEKSMGFEFMKMVTMSKPKSAYMVKVSGAT
jgi:hypothetical protein